MIKYVCKAFSLVITQRSMNHLNFMICACIVLYNSSAEAFVPKLLFFETSRDFSVLGLKIIKESQTTEHG